MHASLSGVRPFSLVSSGEDAYILVNKNLTISRLFLGAFAAIWSGDVLFFDMVYLA